MSKQRAVRRAAREAEAQRRRLRQERRDHSRARWRRLRAAALPRRRRTGRLPSGLTRAERAGIVVGTLAALGFVWLLVDALSTRIALTALILLGAPVLFVLTADRRT